MNVKKKILVAVLSAWSAFSVSAAFTDGKVVTHGTTSIEYGDPYDSSVTLFFDGGTLTGMDSCEVDSALWGHIEMVVPEQLGGIPIRKVDGNCGFLDEVYESSSATLIFDGDLDEVGGGFASGYSLQRYYKLSKLFYFSSIVFRGDVGVVGTNAISGVELSWWNPDTFSYDSEIKKYDVVEFFGDVGRIEEGALQNIDRLVFHGRVGSVASNALQNVGVICLRDTLVSDPRKLTQVSELAKMFDGFGVVRDTYDGYAITVTNNHTGTVTLPDNLGKVVVDLRGHSILGGYGSDSYVYISGSAASYPSNGVDIVHVQGGGTPTHLVLESSTAGAVGKVLGQSLRCDVDGDFKEIIAGDGICVARNVRTGVLISVGENVEVTSGTFAYNNGKPSVGVRGNVAVNRGLISCGESSLAQYSQSLPAGCGVLGNVQENYGTILGGDCTGWLGSNADARTGGIAVCGDVTFNAGVIKGGVASSDFDFLSAGGMGVSGNVMTNNGEIVMGIGCANVEGADYAYYNAGVNEDGYVYENYGPVTEVAAVGGDILVHNGYVAGSDGMFAVRGTVRGGTGTVAKVVIASAKIATNTLNYTGALLRPQVTVEETSAYGSATWAGYEIVNDGATEVGSYAVTLIPSNALNCAFAVEPVTSGFAYVTKRWDEVQTLTWRIVDGGLEALKEAFAGFGTSEKTADGYLVTVTNDCEGTVKLPDNIGRMTIDLNGHDIVGRAGGYWSLSESGQDGLGDGIDIVASGETNNATATELWLVNSAHSVTSTVSGACRGNTYLKDECCHFNGVRVATNANEGVRINVGSKVVVSGGDFCPWRAADGEREGVGIIGHVGVNRGRIIGGRPCYDGLQYVDDGPRSVQAEWTASYGYGIIGRVDVNEGEIFGGDPCCTNPGSGPCYFRAGGTAVKGSVGLNRGDICGGGLTSETVGDWGSLGGGSVGGFGVCGNVLTNEGYIAAGMPNSASETDLDDLKKNLDIGGVAVTGNIDVNDGLVYSPAENFGMTDVRYYGGGELYRAVGGEVLSGTGLVSRVLSCRVRTIYDKYFYTGELQHPKLDVSWGFIGLREGDLVDAGGIDPGTYFVAYCPTNIHGLYISDDDGNSGWDIAYFPWNYTNTIEWTVLDASSIKETSFSGEYDGLGHTVSVSVPESFRIDYAVQKDDLHDDPNGGGLRSAPSATNVCDVSVWYVLLCSGCAPYTNSVSLTITPRSLENTAVAAIPVQTYTGAAIEPVPAVSDSVAVTSNDYAVSYLDNVKPGTAKMILTGRGNYAGAITNSFRIVVPEISNEQYDATVREDLTVVLKRAGEELTGAVTVPSEIDGFPVVELAPGAFSGRQDVTSVVIPETVTNLGHHAFAGCSNLVSVTLPASLAGVGRYAFAECPNLAVYTLPDGVDASACSADGSGNQIIAITVTPHVAWSGAAWDGRFDIAYTVLGAKITGAASVAVRLTASDGSQTWSAVTLSGDDSPGAGEHTLVWDAWADLGAARPAKLTVKAALARLDGQSETLPPLDGSYACDLSLASFRTTDGALSSSAIAVDLAAAVPVRYRVANDGTAIITNGAYSAEGAAIVPETIDGHAVSGVAEGAYPAREGGVRFDVPADIGAFDAAAVAKWTGLKGVVTTLAFGSSTTNFSIAALRQFVNLTRVVFDGGPEGLSDALLSFLRSSGLEIAYPEESAEAWTQSLSRFATAGVTVLSAEARTNDATVLDVVYRITGATNALPARAVFFKDNVRSFANIVLPRTFADGTESALGAAMEPGVDHHFAWKVSEDWQIDLAKVRAEVMILPGELLPLKFFTIPANGSNKAISVSRNALTEARVLDALFWLYAGGEQDLTLRNGVLRCGDTVLAEGAAPNGAAAVEYLFGKMGLRILKGAELDYVNDCARLGFTPQGVRQYAVREAK